MANKDYNEIWLEAMDLLIYNRLQSLSYDQTVKAKIVKNMGNKTYTVEESNIKYTASSLNNADYNINDEVYVLVPNGDYTAQKLIIGKAQRTDANSAIDFVSPLDSMVSIDKLPIVMPADWHGLTANGEIQIICLASFDLTTQSDSIKYNSFYDTIGLSADFKTLFSQVNMTDGHYGLMLELLDKNDKQHIALLDSREMFGDPYNYMTFFNQTKKFDIGGIDADIVTLKLYAYQQHDFKMDNGEEIVVYPPKYTNNAGPGQDPIWVPVPDILIENISIFFGHDLNAIADNTFKIHIFDDNEELHNYAAEKGASATRLLYSSWFNKSEANEFIGFSDGVVDETYSEQDYSDKLSSDWSGARLVHSSDIPPLRESLQIYYYADKIDSLLDILRNQAGNELVKIITNLNIYLNKYGQEKNEDILEYVEDTYIPLLNAAGGFEEADSWKESYTKYLEAYKPIYDEYVKDSTYVPTEYPQLATVDSMSVFNAWSELENAFATWFATLGAISENDDQLTDISSYVGRQYRLYKQSLKIIQEACADLEARIETINTEKVKLDNRLRAGASTFDLTTFEEEYQDFIEAYANKYCIYWYQSDVNARGDAWSGEGWVRDEIDPIKNTPGMPAVNGAKYEKKSETQYTAELSGDVAEVKFKAILFFNHVPHISNEITFTNATPPEDPDAESPDDFITISHGQHSQATYNQYSTNFAILNVADSMVNRELIMEYHSVDPEITSAEALNNTTVYWYIPTQSTMLAYDAVKMKKCGYTQLSTLLQNLDEDESMQDDYNEYAQYLRDGYECFFKDIIIEDVENAPAINAFYLISRVYQDSSVLNTIYCKVKKNTSFYETSIEFDFNTFGTSGTQYTLSIEPLRVQTAIEHIALADNKWENKPLYVAVRFTDFNGVAVKNMPAIDFGWYLEGADEWAPVIADELTDTELAEAGIQREIGVLYYKLGESDKRPDEYSNCYYTLLEANCYWNMINVETESEETMTLRAFYPLAQAEGPYYLDGPTTVIYNSLGSEANYLNKPYRLFNNYDNTELTDITWVMEYYNKSGKLIAELEPALAQYAPHLTIVDDDSPIENGIYLSPLMMYIHNWDIYCVVVAKQEDERLYSQPIYIGQNTWESAVVNSWNERLTIDEENGIILSSMVGAGYKDEENRFHGVLMGDVGVKGNADDVKTGVGLYGFYAGAQSFGFNVDGTAFLGRPGMGRILFDGEESTITTPHFLSGGGGIFMDLNDGILQIDDVDGCHLISCSKEQYFLQSHSYQSWENGNANNTAGILINLQPLNAGDPLIDIKGPTQSMFYISSHLQDESNRQYYLQTDGFTSLSGYESGVRFDLIDGSLIGYNFTLKSIDNSNSIYKGSGLTLTSSPLQFFMEIKNSDKNLNTTILSIKETEFLLQSADWQAATTSETYTYTSYYLDIVGELNVRAGPGTSYSVLNTIWGGNRYPCYEEKSGWVKISRDKEQWCSKYLNGRLIMINPQTETGTISTTRQQGMQFDIYNGKLIMMKRDTSGYSIKIDSTAATYPLAINTFQVGWDGSVKGGSAHPWSINASGTVSFNDGTFNDITVNRGRFNNCNIVKGKLTFLTYEDINGSNTTTFDGSSTLFKIYPSSKANWTDAPSPNDDLYIMIGAGRAALFAGVPGAYPVNSATSIDAMIDVSTYGQISIWSRGYMWIGGSIVTIGEWYPGGGASKVEMGGSWTMLDDSRVTLRAAQTLVTYGDNENTTGSLSAYINSLIDAKISAKFSGTKSGTVYADDYWSTGKMGAKFVFKNGLLTSASYETPPTDRNTI